MGEGMAIGFKMKITPIKPINDEMTLCKCHVMALGKNQNRSIISKEAAEDALPTLYNIPVIGHVYVDEDGSYRMGGHDWKLEKTEDDKYRIKTITVPYGTVPYQDNVHFEEVDEGNGVVNTYQVADIILWTGRFPELLDAKYSDGIYFGQSMEIKALETKVEEGYTNIQKYKYSALCLLGKYNDDKNVSPCFPSARVEPYEFVLTNDWDKLFEEFKTKLAASYDINYFTKGGGEVMENEQIEMIIKGYGFSKIEDVPFEIDGLSEEELKNKLNDYSAVAAPNANDSETEANQEVGEKVLFALTCEETRKLLSDSLRAYRICTATDYKDYWLCDFDDKYAYIGFYFVSKDNIEDGNARITYTKTSNEVSINMDTFVKVKSTWLTQDEVDEIDKMRNEITELTEFKEKRMEEDRKKEFSEIISEFSDLAEIDEYKSLVGNALSFESSEALKEKLYALRGKFGKYKEKKTVETVKIPINFDNGEDEGNYRDDFFKKYLSKSIN